jgi:hypothetical protein
MLPSKDSHIQIRINKKQKAILQAAAARDAKELSSWILDRLTPKYVEKWYELCQGLRGKRNINAASHLFAEIHDLLASLNRDELSHLAGFAPQRPIASESYAYLSAMIEYAVSTKKAKMPEWINEAPPLRVPFFGSPLLSLRLHLLTHSPVAYRKRNIFIDAPIGGRV